LNFQAGKLQNAEADWGAFYSKDGIDEFWTAFDGVLSHQARLNNWQNIQIRRFELETPQSGLRTIDIRFPDRTIQLQKGRTESPHAETYSVSEIIPYPLR